MEVLTFLETEPKFLLENEVGKKIRSLAIIVFHLTLHVALVYGFYLMCQDRLQPWTYLWGETKENLKNIAII